MTLKVSHHDALTQLIPCKGGTHEATDPLVYERSHIMRVQVMDIVEDLIRAGQPLRALLTYLSNASIDAAIFPSTDDAATLQQSAQRVCLACYQDSKVCMHAWEPWGHDTAMHIYTQECSPGWALRCPLFRRVKRSLVHLVPEILLCMQVLASGVTLLALCKLPPWRLQIDVAVLRRIKEGKTHNRMVWVRQHHVSDSKYIFMTISMIL